MHPNPVFHTKSDTDILNFSAQHGFGMLTMNTQTYPLTSHVPFIISEDRRSVEFHLAINNPMRSHLADGCADGCKVTLNIMGPHAYISPDWYGAENQVPTWNYAATLICGTATEMPADWLEQHLARLSAEMESRLLPKTPWTIDKMEPKRFQAMTKAIFGVKLDIEHIDGTWKLGQNKPDHARIGAAKALSKLHDDPFAQQMAMLMKEF